MSQKGSGGPVAVILVLFIAVIFLFYVLGFVYSLITGVPM